MDVNSVMLADLFKVFSDETRVRILECLEKSDKSVGDIASELEMNHSAISHQLSVLRKSKLVKSRRDGKNIFYSLDDDHVCKILSCGKQHILED